MIYLDHNGLMDAKVDALKILGKVRGSRPEMGKVSLYLNKEIYRRFQKACKKEGVAAGETIDQLMDCFVESLAQSKVAK
ncbi:MAG: hypothetical protein EOP04_03160 [Proteobacteria bacterium]|nr:MAG: hypothetical protein EOP04_03160 [Pseudomonadota bacterium]